MHLPATWSSGYLEFHFGDKTWLNDTPALGKIEDSDTAPEATTTAVMKKPALCEKLVLPRQKVDAKKHLLKGLPCCSGEVQEGLREPWREGGRQQDERSFTEGRPSCRDAGQKTMIFM